MPDNDKRIVYRARITRDSYENGSSVVLNDVVESYEIMKETDDSFLVKALGTECDDDIYWVLRDNFIFGTTPEEAIEIYRKNIQIQIHEAKLAIEMNHLRLAILKYV